jgi:hypothetical protein
MVVTKKKMKKNYYYLTGGSQKKTKPSSVKHPSASTTTMPKKNFKIMSPTYRMAKHKASKIYYGLFGMSTIPQAIASRHRTHLLNSNIIKHHFTTRTQKQKTKTPAPELTPEQKEKLIVFQQKLEEYEKGNKNTTFESETKKGNFFTKGVRTMISNIFGTKTKTVPKTREFSVELKNMIKQMQSRETSEERSLRYQEEKKRHDRKQEAKITEGEYITQIKERLKNLIPKPKTDTEQLQEKLEKAFETHNPSSTLSTPHSPSQ